MEPSVLTDLGVKLFEGYEDPNHHRPLKMGEVGCFLSHYRVWQKILENNQTRVLIIEDDARFESNFSQRFKNTLKQADIIGGYDLL